MKTEFQIGSIQSVFLEKEVITLYMRANGQTVTSVSSIEYFDSAESVKEVMEAFIVKALEHLYPKKEISDEST